MLIKAYMRVDIWSNSVALSLGVQAAKEVFYKGIIPAIFIVAY